MKVSKEEQEKLGKLGKLGNRRDIKLGRKVHHRKGTVITVLLFMVCFLCLFFTGTKTKAAYTDEMAANMRYLFEKGYVLLDTSNLNVQSNGVGPNWKKAGTLYYKTESGSYVASISSTDSSLNTQEQAMITQMKQSNIYCFDVSKESSSTISFAYSKEGNKQAFYTTKAYNTADIKGNLYAYLAQTTVSSVPAYMIGRVGVPDVEPAKVTSGPTEGVSATPTGKVSVSTTGKATISPAGKSTPSPMEEEEMMVDVEEEKINAVDSDYVTIRVEHDYMDGGAIIVFTKDGTEVASVSSVNIGTTCGTFRYDVNSSEYNGFLIKKSTGETGNTSSSVGVDKIKEARAKYGDYINAKNGSWKGTGIVRDAPELNGAIVKVVGSDMNVEAVYTKGGNKVKTVVLGSDGYLVLDFETSDYDSFYIKKKTGETDSETTGNRTVDVSLADAENYLKAAKRYAQIGGYTGQERTFKFVDNIADASLNIPIGTYTKSDELYYVSSTFYDYYSDVELEGKNRNSLTGGFDSSNGSNDKIQARKFNSAISEYFAETSLKDSSWQSPLYFGEFTNASTSGLVNFNYNNNNATPNKTAAGGVDAARLGLVNGTLVDGKLMMGTDNGGKGVEAPYFSESFLRGDSSGDCLGYVFKNVEFPFEKNSDGYWEFDSANSNHTLRMKQTNKGEYFLDRVGGAGVKGSYTAPITGTANPNFFPFNDVGESGNAKKLNYAFGARIEIPFYMTQDGKVTVLNKNNNQVEQDIVFNFRGDDDIWIFIDDTLVLDIGGDHGAVTGKINFATKNATTTGVSAASAGVQEKNFDAELVSPSKQHTLTLFYMERGLWESNMYISFNFPKTQNLTVEKELDTSDVNPIFSTQMELLKNVSFGIEMKNLVTTYGTYEEGSMIPAIEEAIDAIDCDPTPVITKDPGGKATYQTMTTGYAESDTRKCVLKYQCDGEKKATEGQGVTDARSIYIKNNGLPTKLSKCHDAAARIQTGGYVQFDTYLDKSSNAAAYIALIDGNGNRIGAWTSDGNSYTGTGGFMTSKSWSTRRIMIGKLEQKIGTTFDYGNVVGFQFAFWGSNIVYLDNISIYAPPQYGSAGGFEKPQDQIKDYGSAASQQLMPINGAKYTLGKEEKYIDQGVLYLKNGEQARFSDQFRKHSYIYLNELCDTNVFDVSWEIIEGGISSGNVTPTPAVTGKGTLVDDGRRAPTPTAGGSAPTPTPAATPADQTMLFSSYTGNNSSNYFYDMNVKYTNKVKTGTLKVKKQLKNDTSATFVDQEALLDATLPYWVKITFTNIAGLINSDTGFDTTQSIVVCKEMFVETAKDVVTIAGIPAGTEYTVSEIKKETVSGEVYTSGLDGKDFIVEGIGKKNGSTIDYNGYDEATQSYSGVIVADVKDSGGNVTASDNDIIIINDINPVTEDEDLSGEKTWEVGDEQVISPTAIPKPESVSVKLQKRLKVRDKTTDTTEEFQFSDVNEDETALIKTPISLQIKAETPTQYATWVTANRVTYRIELENKGDWKFAIKGLPKYGKSSQGFRREYEYRIIETSMNYDRNLYAKDGANTTTDVKYKEVDGVVSYNETSTGFTPSGGAKVTDTPSKDCYHLTNTYNPLTTLEITKVSGKDNNVKLEGVEFLLQRIQSGSGESVIFDATFNGNTGKMEGTTGNVGTYSFLNLPDGTYRLTEKKTAAGHSLLANPIKIVISQGGVCTADGKQVYITGTNKDTLALTINNQGVTDLPMTGSRTRWIVIGLGILLVALGEGYYLWNMYHPEAKGAFRKVKTAEGFTFDLGFDEELKGEEHSVKGPRPTEGTGKTRTRKASHKEYGKPIPTKNKNKRRQTENNSQKKKKTGNQGIPQTKRNDRKTVSPRVTQERLPDDTNKTVTTKDKTKTKEKKEIDVII